VGPVSSRTHKIHAPPAGDLRAGAVARRRLLASDYEVITVANGEAAWTAALERAPDLVLAGSTMPGVDGPELVRRLRAEARTRHLP